MRQTDFSEIYRDGFLINTFLETKILTGSYSRGLDKKQQSQRHQRFPSFHDIDEVASSLLASQSAVFLFYDKKKFLIILTLILQTGAFSYF